MNDRQDGAPMDREELREKVLREGWKDSDELAVPGRWPFAPEVDRSRREQMLTALDAWYRPGHSGPWTRLTCAADGAPHDTGAEVRLTRDERGRWWVEPRKRGGKGERATIFGVVNFYQHDTLPNVEVESPERLELRCRRHDRTQYRRPDSLAAPLFHALVRYQATRGHQPRVSWIGD